jgi:hypothetical protein
LTTRATSRARCSLARCAVRSAPCRGPHPTAPYGSTST